MYEQVGQRLREEATKRPELASTIDLYCALLEVQARVRVEPGGALDITSTSSRLAASGYPCRASAFLSPS